MFWGALRRVWDPSCGVALLNGVDGCSARVGFESWQADHDPA
jgi:hypothetical protein